MLPKHRVHRIAASIYFFIAGVCFASWTSRIPDIQARLHLNYAQLGTVLFADPDAPAHLSKITATT